MRGTRRNGSLLPVPVTPQPSASEMQAPSHRAGAALQLDGFTLFVGRFLLWLGIIGTLVEVGTSTRAIMITFLSNPGPEAPASGWDLLLSLFFSLCVESGMLTLVINLNDSWINVFEGHPERAFITNGEVNLHLLILWAFEFGGAAVNVWWNITFFGSITTSGFLISVGTTLLLFSSLLMWPLGMKVTRNAKRRRRAAKRLAQEMTEREESQRVQRARNIVVESDPSQKGLLPFQRRSTGVHH